MATVQYTPEEQSHMAVIKHLLMASEKVRDMCDKSAIVTQLLNYIVENAIPLTQRTLNFRKTVVGKCYEFKRDAPSYHGLIVVCNRVLTALGEPLDEPMSPDLELFVSIVKRFSQLANLHDSYMREKFRIFNIYNTHGYEMRGTTLEEKMENYIVNDMLKPIHPTIVAEYRKKQDMKRFATSQGLSLTDDVMTQYHAWDDALGERLNRYEKMMRFIKEHKNLFTTV
jgi:hypothetical protein